MIKPLYRIKGLEGLFTLVVPSDHYGKVIMESVNLFPMQTITTNVMSLREFIVSDDEQLAQPFNYENMTIEGEFYVEKAGDVMTIRVKNGKMSIYKGE